MNTSARSTPGKLPRRRKPIPHKQRRVGGQHRPIVLGEVFCGLEVLWQAASDNQGNRRVYYQCFCGRAGRGRFGDLWQRVIKSCGCLRTLRYKELQEAIVREIPAEHRREIFTEIRKGTNAHVIAAMYNLEKATIDFVRRGEYRRLDDFPAEVKEEVDDIAMQDVAAAQLSFGLTHAEIMAIHTLETQRRLREQVHAEVMVAEGNLAPTVCEPLPVTEDAACAASGPVAECGWASRTKGYRAAAGTLAREAHACAMVICRGQVTGEIKPKDLLNPKKLKAYATPRNVFSDLFWSTHHYFGESTSRASRIFTASALRNYDRMKDHMLKRAALVFPLTREQAADEARKKAWAAACRKRQPKSKPEEDIEFLGTFNASREEEAEMAEMLNEIATSDGTPYRASLCV